MAHKKPQQTHKSLFITYSITAQKQTIPTGQPPYFGPPKATFLNLNAKQLRRNGSYGK